MLFPITRAREGIIYNARNRVLPLQDLEMRTLRDLILALTRHNLDLKGTHFEIHFEPFGPILGSKSAIDVWRPPDLDADRSIDPRSDVAGP